MKKVIIYNFWLEGDKDSVFSEQFFVLFQWEILNALLSNQPAV